MENNLIHTGSEKISLTFKKAERLKSLKIIDQLFSEGGSFLSFPLKVVFLNIRHTSEFPVQAGFSMSKKNFKTAVERNSIKRKMREAYRLNKQELYNNLGEKKLAVFFIFIGKTKPDFALVESGMKKAFKKLALSISELNE